MSHIQQVVDTFHLHYVCFVVCEIIVSLEIVTVFYFDINHTAVNACSHRNCHGQSSLDTFDRFHGNRMSHTHPRAEVCISDTFRHHCFQQGANNRVASRIPSGRNNGNRIMCFGYSIQRTAQVYDTSVDIEAIYRIDT